MLLFFGSLGLLMCFLSSLLVLLWLPDLDLIFDIVVGANHTTDLVLLIHLLLAWLQHAVHHLNHRLQR